MRLPDEHVSVYEVWERHSAALPVAPERALQPALAAPPLDPTARAAP